MSQDSGSCTFAVPAASTVAETAFNIRTIRSLRIDGVIDEQYGRRHDFTRAARPAGDPVARRSGILRAIDDADGYAVENT
ncbi:hypothetical protein [Saccharopolyspora phatthalungensis]|uniref:Uncharacterized protein n=1 Tax=Saccharopolyspora phatthalungensis TaxID=664693 RepID=A0A840QFG6_9PSEU|nr:hypothetical protein [Saccharopolyspora phatthalungensis]MBB5159176.1 hypothetical protein [Saccharopolyspora phatthalungensis]